MYTRLMQCEMEDYKRIMCCLIALGLDDVDMMARAACLSPHSVKAYRKECRELVGKAKNTSTVGMDDGKKNRS